MTSYPVAGGWQAEDEHLRIACFGATEDEAKGALEKAVERAHDLTNEAERIGERGEE